MIKSKLLEKFIKNLSGFVVVILLLISVRTFADSPSFPLISNLKNASEYFVGREKFLKDMHEFLFEHKKHHALVISGCAGAGKTQVITRYAELHKVNYEIIWWFDVNKDLDRQYRNFAKAWNRLVDKHYKDIAEQNFLQINLESGADHIVEEVHDRLKHTKLSWLIIIDSVKDSAIAIRDFPKHNNQGSGHIIISTQNSALHANVMRLTTLSREESIELLLKVTGENDINKANSLADTLGDYPLAVSAAGNFIAANSALNMDEYNRLFKTKRQELWEAENQLEMKRNELRGYKSTISTYFSMSINQIKKESALAYELFAIVSFLDSDNIPEDLLLQYVKENYGQDSIDIGFKNALSTLLKQSLLIRNYKNQKLINEVTNNNKPLFTTYEMMQLSMQDLLTLEEKQLYLNKTIIAANKFLSRNIYQLTNFLSEYSYFTAHIAALTKHAVDLELYNNDVLQLSLRELEYNLSSLGNNQKAEELISRVEKVSQHVSNQDNLSMLRFALMKSAFQGGNGNYEASLKEALYAYGLSKISLEDVSPDDKLMIYNRLARLYNITGNNVDAFKFAELGRKILDNTSTLRGHRQDFYRIMVKIYVDSGDFAKALEYSELTAVKLDSQKISPLSDISAHLINADILIRLGKYSQAMQKLNLLSQVISNSLPAEHLYKANIMTYISYVQTTLGLINAKQAIQTILAAQAMYKKLIGEAGYYKHRHVFMSYRFLGEIYERQKNYLKAEEEYSVGLKIISNIYGSTEQAKTDDLSNFYCQLAVVNIKLQRQKAALKYYDLHNQVFELNHPKSIKLMEYFVDNDVDLGF